MAALLVGKRSCSRQCGPHRSLVAMALLDEHKLRRLCGSLVATLFVSRLCQRFLPCGRCLSALFSNCRLGLSVPLVSLVGYGLCSCGNRLLKLLLSLQRASAAFLLVLQAGNSSLMLLSLQGLASKLGMEALTAKPQEDDSGCRRLLCMGSTLATSDLLVEYVLATHSLLAFEGSS
jgi:hypothetical protein